MNKSSRVPLPELPEAYRSAVVPDGMGKLIVDGRRVCQLCGDDKSFTYLIDPYDPDFPKHSTLGRELSKTLRREYEEVVLPRIQAHEHPDPTNFDFTVRTHFQN